nr:hypothetical protein Iba_chr01dCG8110 [Ipomoea batatas]
MNGSSIDDRWRWILDLEVGVYFSDLAMIGSDWRQETESDDEAEHRLPRLEVAGRRWMAMDFRSCYLKAQTNFISGCWSLFLMNGSSVDDRWRWILDLEVGVCLSDLAMIGSDWWEAMFGEEHLEVGVYFSDLAMIGSDWWEAMFGEERENGEAECKS